MSSIAMTALCLAGLLAAAAAPVAGAVEVAAATATEAPAQAVVAAATATEAPAAGAPAVADAGEAFVHANAAYEAGDYHRAAELYQALLAAVGERGHVLYNLGNAYLRSGELGRAVAAYRRSQALLPRDRDLAANLAFARKSARDAVPPPEPSPVLATLFFWHYHLSRAELLRLTVLFNALLWGVLALRLTLRGSEALRWLAGLSLLLLLASGGSLLWRTVAPERIAVVLPQEVDVRSGTGAASVVRFKLHAGSEVRLIERQDGWLRIALPDGEQGWIEEQHAVPITL
jgi:tetratricopeptide (TPR) repeat protein